MRELPTVVLVPGLGLDARDYTQVRRALGAPHRVVLLPALGTRPGRSSDLEVPVQAVRLLAGLAEVTKGSVILVGHSASCPVVVEAARRSPDVVGLLLVGPVTDPRGRSWGHIARRWLRTAPHERTWEVPLLVPQYLRVGLWRSVWRGMDAMRWFSTDEALRDVHVPVVIARGSHDAIAPAGWSGSLAQASGRELVVVPGGGHMITLTHPDVVARLADGLAQNGSRVAHRSAVGET